MTRREFIKKLGYLSMCVPLFTTITKLTKTKTNKETSQLNPRPARYFKELAG